MLIHITLPVRQFAASIAFYDAALATLGASRSASSVHAAGYAIGTDTDTRPFLWLKPNNARPGAVNTRVALVAKGANPVQEFHTAAMAHGAVSIAAPAPMPQYGVEAFGCTVHDPDGHQIEVIAFKTQDGNDLTKPDRALNDMLDGEAPDYPNDDYIA